MEPDRYRYSPILGRPRWRLPGNARVALWIVPNVEHYEYLPDTLRQRDPWPRTPHPDVLGYSVRDYGNRVGFWRMFDMFDRLGIRSTVSLNLAVYEHYPEIMEAIEIRGWDVMCHGLYNTRYHWGLAEPDERAEIAACVDLFRRLTGRMLTGWFSPGVSNTLITPDLIAEAGIGYSADFYHDDQPTPLRVRGGQTLISVPYTMDLNDAVLYRYDTEGAEFARMIRDHFETVWREGEVQPRVMCVALHPYIMGQPHRIRHLERALGDILSRDGVWLTSGVEIAQWYRDNGLAEFRAHLGTEG
ncbi:polysaccharide deacetylase family protein [Sediminicoccus sp. KRV36]|uniref:polysaccharide deacetylase family protein n=1 Tax=Sediminicoccus sp. KRV36 TaxID=3133721 RepID=UPI00200C96FF|nr:polysaccharide deacetylase family protein [Sediminicoccus rosea]UPY38747.1 polysaccharide deacetylase family protein [Sediminicoccus rosea]